MTKPPAPPPLLLQHQLQPQQPLQTLSPSSSNSPEFEFWMVHNPTQPQPDLLSADQLFLDGVLLPLHLLHLKHPPDPKDKEAEAEAEAQNASSEPGPRLTSEPHPTTSNRWTDIFKRREKKSRRGGVPEDKNRGKQVHRRVNSAELNIKLWPFLRSRSEGNGAARPRLSSVVGPSSRRVSSAPCSRSNSGGGDHPKSSKWPGSPARPGLHLGRTSPVWQVKRSPRGGGGGRKARVLNQNVPICRRHLGCRADENVGIGRVRDNGRGSGSGSGGAGNMFNLRGLFPRKMRYGL